MRLKMYTDVVISELKSSAKSNPEYYDKEAKFIKDIIQDYDDKLYDLNIDVVYPMLSSELKSDDKILREIDCENSILLHKEFIMKYNIPLSKFSDERFISYLTHDVYYDYMIKRWPANNKQNRIKEKYFLPSGNVAFTRNQFLKMFWYPYLTYDENNKEDPYHLTRVAFNVTDPVSQIMERKYSKNKKITMAALKAIDNLDSNMIPLLNKKRTFFGKVINNILGLSALDVFPEKDLINLFEEEIKIICSLDIEDEELINEE